MHFSLCVVGSQALSGEGWPTELNLIAHLSELEGEKIVLIDRGGFNANAVVFDLNSIGGEVGGA